MKAPCEITNVVLAMGLVPISRQADDWRFGTKGSLSVNPKNDTFYDFEAETGGGVYDFVIHRGHATDPSGAREWLKAQGLVSDDVVTALSVKGSNVLREHIYRNPDGSINRKSVKLCDGKWRQMRYENDTFTPGVKGVPNVPYGADRLAEDFSDKMAFIFEGEKDVERAWDRGLLATCNVGGAKNWKDELNAHLKDRNVCIVPDNDKAGTNHAQKVYASLTKSGIDCFILWDYREGLPDKGDFSDWMDANNDDVDMFIDLATTAQQKPREPVKSSKAKIDDEPEYFQITEQWDEPVDGCAVLDLVHKTLLRFCVLPEHSAPAITVWIAHAWAHEEADISPILAAISPEKGCGKSTLMSVISALVPKPMYTINMSPAVMFRVIEKFKPTILIDEGDTFLKDNEDMRCMLNGGHNRQTSMVWRSVGDTHEPKPFKVWAPKALAMIGSPADTVEDRSIVVHLKRKLRTDKIQGFNERRKAELHPIQRMLARWYEDNQICLRTCDPEVPQALNDRAQDNVRSLCAIADAVGGHWPETLRQAFVGLAQAREEAQQVSNGVMLLHDIAEVLEGYTDPKIGSGELQQKLVFLEDSAWEHWNRGQQISTKRIAQFLKDFEVYPDRDATSRFYHVSQLRAAIERYDR